MGDELILGVNGGSPEELAELGANAVFFWLPDGSPDESRMKGFLQTLDKYRAKGAKYFLINSVAPWGPEFFDERTEDAANKKTLKYAYTFNGPIAELFLNRTRTAAGWRLPVIHNFVPDEIYYANAHIPYTFRGPLEAGDTYLCGSAEEREAFRTATGLDLPPLTRSRLLKQNTREARQFILFRYRTLADTLKQWQQAARDVNPQIETYTMLNLRAVYGLERYPGGLALDMLGPDAGFDYVSATSFQCSYDWRGPDTHYYVPETIKHLRAGLPNARVFAFNTVFAWLPDSRAADGLLPLEQFAPAQPLGYYGTALSSVAHGAGGFISLRGGTPKHCTPEIWETQKKVFATLNTIRPWIEGAAPPKDIALLYSRAGEDFYALANEDPDQNAQEDGSEHMLRTDHVQQKNYISYHLVKDRPETRGFLAHKKVMHFLFQNGYPFDLFYLDTLMPEQILPYRVLILPFAHAISRDAAETLDQAAAAGKKLLLFDQLGEIDQEGEPHETLLLTPLVGRQGVVQLLDGDSVDACQPDASARIRRELDALLGETKSFALLEGAGAVEATMLEKSATDKTVFLINWEDKPVTAKICVRLPTGSYRISQRDLVQTSSFSAGGNARFSHTDLESLSLPLGPEGVLVLHITAAAE